ncbi:hypothetical protein LTS18_009953 [Coniosporium uncinatum]|uniref:Uncharacterized protein n=1 Tax=Coniosporium uncinatum TaxID=93489 RepID=A0ACC3DX58_9PEZI|nr:hypothetical protein LTS18_009953 [Coniosporium uncinatum]
MDTGPIIEAQPEPLSDMDADLIPDSVVTHSSEVQFSQFDHPFSEGTVEHLEAEDKTICPLIEVEKEGHDSKQPTKPQAGHFQRPLSAGDDVTHGFSFGKASKQAFNFMGTRKPQTEGPQVESELPNSRSVYTPKSI